MMGSSLSKLALSAGSTAGELCEGRIRLAIDAACTTTLLQGNKSTYIGRRADLYCSDDEAI